MSAPLVALEGIHAGYGRARVLFDLSLEVRAGEVVTLLGRNGMGKTTTLKTLFGLIEPGAGRIRIHGQDVTSRPPYEIARHGLGYVPEGRRIFARLSVEENLLATARPGPWNTARIYALFPRLAERRAHLGTQLSGGEQQMLAIGRALMTNPSLLVLDEASEGLAPIIREQIWQTIRHLKAEGLALLLVDKNLDALIELADRHVVIEKGHIVWTGTSSELAADIATVHGFMHV